MPPRKDTGGRRGAENMMARLGVTDTHSQTPLSQLRREERRGVIDGKRQVSPMETAGSAARPAGAQDPQQDDPAQARRLPGRVSLWPQDLPSSLLPFPSDLSSPASSTCLLAHIPHTAPSAPSGSVLPCCQCAGVSRCRFRAPGLRI